MANVKPVVVHITNKQLVIERSYVFVGPAISSTLKTALVALESGKKYDAGIISSSYGSGWKRTFGMHSVGGRQDDVGKAGILRFQTYQLRL